MSYICPLIKRKPVHFSNIFNEKNISCTDSRCGHVFRNRAREGCRTHPAAQRPHRLLRRECEHPPRTVGDADRQRRQLDAQVLHEPGRLHLLQRRSIRRHLLCNALHHCLRHRHDLRRGIRHGLRPRSRMGRLDQHPRRHIPALRPHLQPLRPPHLRILLQRRHRRRGICDRRI